MPDSFSISGKIAIVTGAGSGIGRGIAEVLANNGAKVVVVDIDETKAKSTAEQIRRAGNISSPMAADVSSWVDMQKMAAAVVKEYDRIDILCENAGIYPPANIIEMSEGQWDKVIDVNLKGCFLGLKSSSSSNAQTKLWKSDYDLLNYRLQNWRDWVVPL